MQNLITTFLTRFNIIGAALLAGAIIVTSCGTKSQPGNYIARVDNKYLTTDDINFLSIINPDGKVPEGQLQSFLNDWVNTELLAQQAKKYDLDKDPYLRSRLEAYHKDLLADMYMRYHIYKAMEISEQEIKNYYDEHNQTFMWELDGAEVTHYFAADRDTAVAIYNILRSGSSEERQLLYQQNQPETKVVTRQDVIPEVGDAIFDTRANGVLSIVESDFGFHVIVVRQRFRAGTIKDLEQVRSTIRERLLVTAQKKHYYQIIDSLKGVVDVEVNRETYDNIVTQDGSSLNQ